MEPALTAAAQRVFSEAARWTDIDGRDELLAPALLLGLLTESECQAALMLAQYGIDASLVCRKWPTLKQLETPPPPRPLSAEVKFSLAAATQRLGHFPQPLVYATEHLLLGLAATEHETGVWLREKGVNPDALEKEISERYSWLNRPLPLEDRESTPHGCPEEGARESQPPLSTKASEQGQQGKLTETVNRAMTTLPAPSPLSESDGICTNPPSEQIGLLRVLDAAGNRAREGIRVVEDFARFVLDDRHLTDQLKRLRHELTAALERVPLAHRLAARETQADVGTQLSTPAERCRQDTTDVLTANFIRVQEALRSLEEFAKILDPDLAARLEQLRYRSYTLHRAVEITRASLNRLDNARLYVLIDGQANVELFTTLARSLIDAGVHILQLRDKKLDDRSLLERARRLRELTRGTKTLFVMNDRPDLAVLARADGVHVGQDELSVKDARTIVGPEMLIGVSTHSLAQAQQAVLDGANYIGVGPTFPSDTKHFDAFPGLELVRQVAASIRLPAFAIGGINRENLAQVLAAGLRRVAVSGAVTGAANPAAAAKELLERRWEFRT
jgi:thiamine-phosphate pyrophosphorylase